MHVPMIMKLPAVAQRQNRRVEQIASLMDIMPTLIDPAVWDTPKCENLFDSLDDGGCRMNHVIWCWRHSIH